MDEGLVYNSGNIVVSKTLAQFGGVSYPINGIGSVFVRKPSRAWLLTVGGILAVGSALALAGGGGGEALAFLLVGLVIIVAAFFKPHALVLRTASGDQQAYTSRDKSELFAIKSAIERAVSLRG